MKSVIDISIIVPTMNRYKSLIDTVQSIYKNKYVPNELIIVDQSNEDIYDGSLEDKLIKLLNIELINIKVIRQKQPSLTKARNLGYKEASNEYIICSDDDIICEEDTIYNIYNKFKKDDSIAMISAWDNNSINKTNNKTTYYLGSIFGTKNIFKESGHITKAVFGNYPTFQDKTINVEWAMGYFFAIRKSLKDKWNIEWDEKLISYAYPEDLDFSISFYKMCRSNGYKIIMDPTIKVTHVVSKEWRVASYKSTLMFVINREYLSYKHFSSPMSRALTRWANIGEIIKRILRKDNAIDVIKAQLICDKNRNYLKKHIIPYDIFESN